MEKNHSAAKPTRIVTEDPKKPRGLSPEEEQEIQARMMQDLQSSMSKMEDTLKPLGDAKVVYENEMVLIELNLKATIASADFEDIKNKCPFASLTIDKKYLLEIMVRHFSGFKDVKIVDDKIYIKDRLANLAGVNLVSSLQSAIKDAVAAAPEMQAQEKYEEAVAKLAQIPAIDELECQWQFLSNWTKNNETTIKENYISDNDKKKRRSLL
ncbi:MAG: hypothetical protein HWD59_10655 [Coxiellaceae bacterium]|nr:MAG: hypothetical protein HWD59_10655 [Coxiellaceae bacterium]